MAASDTMSWRRFIVLLRNLSANSILSMSIQLDKKEQAEKPLEGKEAERAAFAMLGGKRVGD